MTPHTLLELALFTLALVVFARLSVRVHRLYVCHPRNRLVWFLEYLRSVAVSEAVPERPGGKRV